MVYRFISSREVFKINSCKGMNEWDGIRYQVHSHVPLLLNRSPAAVTRYSYLHHNTYLTLVYYIH